MTQLRNHLFGWMALIVVALLASGCAGSHAAETPPTAASSSDKPITDQIGPFDVAQQWAQRLDDYQRQPAQLPTNVRKIIEHWKSARVERVWAAGADYRAVVVQRSTANETPAVLLYIGSDDAGHWKVTGLQPTTSTYLWSQL